MHIFFEFLQNQRVASSKKPFVHHSKLYEDPEAKKAMDDKVESMKTSCTIIKAIVHTQPNKIKSLHTKKAHIYEINIKGGSTKDKVDFVMSKFEKDVNVDEFCEESQVVDVAGVTTGKGYCGVVKRFGVKRLQRKTRRGRRKVACIGSWHPANIQTTVPRSGQMGFSHRVEKNKKIYAIKNGMDSNSASTF